MELRVPLVRTNSNCAERAQRLNGATEMTSKDQDRKPRTTRRHTGSLAGPPEAGEAATVFRRLLKAIPIFQARPMKIARSLCGNWSMRTLLPRLKTKYERWITRILRARWQSRVGLQSSPRRPPGKFSRKLWNPFSMI